MPQKKNYYKDLEEKLTLKQRSCWEVWDDKLRKESFSFSEKYKTFLNDGKTEQEVIAQAVKIAEKNGYKDITRANQLKVGDKVYAVNDGKSMILAQIGKKGLSEGAKILMAHIDSPHLDFKVHPLYEDEGLALMKTHYYGGIKKYQWPTINLAIHGKAFLANGKSVEIKIGEKDEDPVFMITDLLPHLDKNENGTTNQSGKILAEQLNLVVGNIPVKDKGVKEKVKMAILEYLNKEYGIEEADFMSTELEAVPSEKARDLGFDRSMISAYGHDDRVCSYSSLKGLLDSKPSAETQVCILIDREEIGSDGMSGAKSAFIEVFFSDLLKLMKQKSGLEEVYRVFSKSKALSSDVTVAADPDYKDVLDPRHAHKLGYGVVIEKYTGAGGKYSTSEASAEYIQKLRILFNKNKDIVYDIGGGLGKVDLGGGGTIAKYMANRNIQIVDMGVPVLNMHAPLEIISKADLYCAYLAYKEFLK